MAQGKLLATYSFGPDEWLPKTRTSMRLIPLLVDLREDCHEDGAHGLMFIIECVMASVAQLMPFDYTSAPS